jgi:hypothetical protein
MAMSQRLRQREGLTRVSNERPRLPVIQSPPR